MQENPYPDIPEFESSEKPKINKILFVFIGLILIIVVVYAVVFISARKPACGNGVCEVNETCSSCSTDCGSCTTGGGGSGGRSSRGGSTPSGNYVSDSRTLLHSYSVINIQNPAKFPIKSSVIPLSLIEITPTKEIKDVTLEVTSSDIPYSSINRPIDYNTISYIMVTSDEVPVSDISKMKVSLKMFF